MNNELISKAVEDFEKSKMAYTKFTSANDTGSTGGHQAGWHIHKGAWNLFFDEPGVKGNNKDRFIKIKWQDDFETDSRVIYYGVGTRNEYRLTRFGKGFPFLREENEGDFVLFLLMDDGEYKAYVFTTDDEIESFTSETGISVTEANKIIFPEKKQEQPPALEELIQQTAAEVGNIMPPGTWIASRAMEILFQSGVLGDDTARKDPDEFLLKLIETEYQLFQAIERNKYGEIIAQGFESVEAFISTAHTILNSRKSRAGHSLENHLSSIFDKNEVKYECQVVTEGKKTADFIFPDCASYHNPNFLVEDLFFMAAKTTCKDRWRQILNEADRLDTSYLMTLQQSISKAQCAEMKEEGVILVVPERYKPSFPAEYRNQIFSLQQFITTINGHQGSRRSS